jgi:nucleoside phosphorylase/DNA-binding CsgD family transcriptional regulator
MDVGIVIALKEELREFMAVLPVKFEPEHDPETGLVGYIFEHPSTHHRCVVTLIGEMTLEPATLQTDRLLSCWSPHTVVMLGIAAGIHPDVRVGDVVIASQVDHYLASAKAEPGSSPDTFEFSLGGTVYHADFGLLTQVRNFEFNKKEVFSRWSRDCVQMLRELIPEEEVRNALAQKKLVREAPQLLDAHLASESVVGAAQQFTQWLRRQRDRNLKVLDMESAGLMAAAVRRIKPTRTLVVRGVSDYGDERKGELDAVGEGALRRYAMHNASWLLWELLGAEVLPRDGEALRRVELPGRAPAVTEPPIPRYQDDETRLLDARRQDARKRKARLEAIGAPVEAVAQEIKELSRQMREGGRLRAGDELGDGRFWLISEIGRGGFGGIWKAYDRQKKESVAIKVLHASYAGDVLRRERFFRGARVMSELRHPAVVRVIEPSGEDGGFYYFVMELVTGGDFRQAVIEKKITQEQIISIVMVISEALAYAHSKGIIHRDIKPSNILLNDAGQPLLTDFDLVGVADTTGGTDTGPLGTVVYAAPESLYQPQYADARVDVYGLGMTAVFGLYGADLPLYVLRETEKVLRSTPCSQALAHVLRRATSWEPDKRYGDAGEFLDALLRVRAGPSQEVSGESWIGQELDNAQKIALEALASSQGAEVVMIVPPATEVLRTRGATALLESWFVPEELSGGGLPTELLERVGSLVSGRNPRGSNAHVWVREGLDRHLEVKFVPVPGEYGERLWMLILREKRRDPVLPSEWRQILTAREAQVVEYVLRGWDNQLVADHLKCKKATVEVHLKRVFDKLGVDSRAALMHKAARNQAWG